MIKIETIIGLQTEVNRVLKTKFPLIKRNSNDTKEGFKKPCFFTKVIPLNMSYQSKNVTQNKVMVVINYFSDQDKERERYEMANKLIAAFGITLSVNKRVLLLTNINNEIIDGVLQFKFNLEYLDKVQKTDNSLLMKEIDMEIEKE